MGKHWPAYFYHLGTNDSSINLMSFCFSLIGGSDYKLIYRHYATLYFVFCVDSSESELGILDLIQVFVETLDKCFENVCELDLIFHVDKVPVLMCFFLPSLECIFILY